MFADHIAKLSKLIVLCIPPIWLNGKRPISFCMDMDLALHRANEDRGQYLQGKQDDNFDRINIPCVRFERWSVEL